jgi:hypothetical protein
VVVVMSSQVDGNGRNGPMPSHLRNRTTSPADATATALFEACLRPSLTGNLWLESQERQEGGQSFGSPDLRYFQPMTVRHTNHPWQFSWEQEEKKRSAPL